MIDRSWSDQAIAEWIARLKRTSPASGYARFKELTDAGCEEKYLVTTLMALEAIPTWSVPSKRAVEKMQGTLSDARNAIDSLGDSYLGLYVQVYRPVDLNQLSNSVEFLNQWLRRLLAHGLSEKRHLLQEKMLSHIVKYVRSSTGSDRIEAVSELISSVLEDDAFDLGSRLKRAQRRRRRRLTGSPPRERIHR